MNRTSASPLVFLALCGLSIAAGCVPAAPTPTPQPTQIALLATSTSVPTSTPLPTPTWTLSPTDTPTATRTATPRPTDTPKPTATKVWTGGTFLVETSNLQIDYPDFLDPSEARKHADILQRTYDTYLALFGNEYPYGGQKIVINFHPELKDISYSGNPIRMGTDSEIFSGRLNPPSCAYYHELVHDFTSDSKTQAARYIDLNGAMDEAFANFFCYYFGRQVLKYSATDIQWYDDYRANWLDALTQYESRKIDPYSLVWQAHTNPQYYFTGMLFRVSDKCGWGVWQQFFVVAKNSGNPGLPPNLINQLNDMRGSVAKKAFSDFVALLSQACTQDLRPMFQGWRFELQ